MVRKIKKEDEKTQRCLIFIDAGSLNAMQGVVSFSIDYLKLSFFLAAGRELVGVRYYAKKDPNNPRLVSFLKFLKLRDYEVIEVDASQDDEADDKEIAEDIHKMFDKAEVIILVGGDHAYYDALLEAKSAGKTIEVLCPGKMLFAEIENIADKVIDPAEHMDALSDPGRTKKYLERRREVQGDRANGQPNVGETATLLAQLFANGTQIKVETTSTEIIFRVAIQKPE